MPKRHTALKKILSVSWMKLAAAIIDPNANHIIAECAGQNDIEVLVIVEIQDRECQRVGRPKMKDLTRFEGQAHLQPIGIALRPGTCAICDR